MVLNTDLEEAKNEIYNLDLLKIGQENVVLSERDVVLLAFVRLILTQLKIASGGESSVDYAALADAIAARTLSVSGDSVDEVALANAIKTALALPSTYSAALTSANITALADAIAARTLSVSGDSVDETALANAIKTALALPNTYQAALTSANINALADAIASKTLSVSGDSVDEVVLANAIKTALALPSTYTAALTSTNINALADAIANKSFTLADAVTSGNKLVIFPDGSIQTKKIDAIPIVETPLTTPGSTPARSVSGYRYYSYQVQVSGIGSNVVVRMEGTHLATPGVNDWYSLQANNIDTTITADGAYKEQISGETDLQVRITLVSFVGGSPSVTCILIKGN